MLLGAQRPGRRDLPRLADGRDPASSARSASRPSCCASSKRLDGLVPYLVADNWATFFVTIGLTVLTLVRLVGGEIAIIVVGILVHHHRDQHRAADRDAVAAADRDVPHRAARRRAASGCCSSASLFPPPEELDAIGAAQ